MLGADGSETLFISPSDLNDVAAITLGLGDACARPRVVDSQVVVIAHIHDDQVVTRGRVSHIPDAANDAVAFELVLELHGKAIPDVALGFAAVFAGSHILTVR